MIIENLSYQSSYYTSHLSDIPSRLWHTSATDLSLPHLINTIQFPHHLALPNASRLLC